MKISLLGVQIDSVSYFTATHQVIEWAQQSVGRCVCCANVHMLMEAHDSCNFMNIINQSDLIVPDGMPLVWLMRAKGCGDQKRVYGPTLMSCIVAAAARGKIPIGFYGGKPEVLEALVGRLQTQNLDLNVAYSLSPPFHALSLAEDDQVIEQINQSGVNILFVGLGCPLQEKWMAAHKGRIHAVMVGVGAAFDFYAGVKAQAPEWMQATGLEWLFRLTTEPGRLWKRYLIHNPRFIFLAIAELCGLIR